MINLKQALIDPSSIFASPKDILLNNELTKDQKIEILKRWEYDILELQVAEEENMMGKDSIRLLEQILSSLHILDAIIDSEHTPPTKQGGIEG